MLEVSPDHRLFAEPLNRRSGKSPVGIRSKDTNPDDYFAIIGIELHDLDSHRTPLVIAFEHDRKLSPVYRVRQRAFIAVHNLGRFRDILVTITQFTQPV